MGRGRVCDATSFVQQAGLWRSRTHTTHPNFSTPLFFYLKKSLSSTPLGFGVSPMRRDGEHRISNIDTIVGILSRALSETLSVNPNIIDKAHAKDILVGCVSCMSLEKTTQRRRHQGLFCAPSRPFDKLLDRHRLGLARGRSTPYITKGYSVVGRASR